MGSHHNILSGKKNSEVTVKFYVNGLPLSRL